MDKGTHVRHRVVLAGYYGLGNLGDELLLHVVLEQLKSRPQIEPCVLSGNPEQTHKRYGVRAANRASPPSIVRALWGARALLFGGGGLLQDTTSARSLSYYLGLMRLAKWLGVPVLLWGQGLGPLSDRGQQHVANTLKNVAYVGVRDPASATLLKRRHIEADHQGPDLALSLSPTSPPASQGAVSLLGLSLAPPQAAHRKAVLRRLTSALEWVRTQHDLTPIFLACNQHDLAFGMDLAQRVPLTVLPLNLDSPQNQVSLFSGLKVVWGSRLHALVLSTLAGVPYAALGYDPKIQHFVTQVNGHIPYDLPHWPLESVDEKTLVQATDMLLGGGHDYESQLRQAAIVLRDEARATLADAGHHLDGLLGL